MSSARRERFTKAFTESLKACSKEVRLFGSVNNTTCFVIIKLVRTGCLPCSYACRFIYTGIASKTHCQRYDLAVDRRSFFAKSIYLPTLDQSSQLAALF